MFYPEGVYPAMLMPFDQDGLVNEKELRSYVDFLIKGGLHGLFPAGDLHKALELQGMVPVLMRTMFSVQFPLGFKEAAALRGFDMGPALQPLGDDEQEHFQKIKAQISSVMEPVMGLAQSLAMH